jgi:hypothetical protein
MSAGELALLVVVLVAATMAWLAHAAAWDLGGRTPVLSPDTAPVAVAARELAQRGTLTSPAALPMELAVVPGPPWPLASGQPGLVLVQALVLAVVPQEWVPGSNFRGWLTLVLPFACFLMVAASLALGVRHLFARTWPDAPEWAVLGAGLALALGFTLDPAAQRAATSGVPELPVLLGLLFLVLGLALEVPTRSPLAFGAVLAGTAWMRLDLLPVLAALAVLACMRMEAGLRRGAGLRLGAGCVAVLLPWAVHLASGAGASASAFAGVMLWDRVPGHDAFTALHQAAVPATPAPGRWPALLAGKVAGHLPELLEMLTVGPRGLWLGSLAAYLLTRPARPLATAVLGLFVLLGGSLLVAALTVPAGAVVLPARLLAEAAGVLALWALLRHAAAAALGGRTRVVALVAVGLLATGWGAWSTPRGWQQARAASTERALPGWLTLASVAMMLGERLEPGEMVMSNLGAQLAWQTRRAVVHLALSPAEVAACRRRTGIRHILLVHARGTRAWPAWREVFESAGAAAADPHLAAVDERRFTTRDGFEVVWIELPPLGPALASARGALPGRSEGARRPRAPRAGGVAGPRPAAEDAGPRPAAVGGEVLDLELRRHLVRP